MKRSALPLVRGVYGRVRRSCAAQCCRQAWAVGSPAAVLARIRRGRGANQRAHHGRHCGHRHCLPPGADRHAAGAAKAHLHESLAQRCDRRSRPTLNTPATRAPSPKANPAANPGPVSFETDLRTWVGAGARATAWRPMQSAQAMLARRHRLTRAGQCLPSRGG